MGEVHCIIMVSHFLINEDPNAETKYFLGNLSRNRKFCFTKHKKEVWVVPTWTLFVAYNQTRHGGSLAGRALELIWGGEFT